MNAGGRGRRDRLGDRQGRRPAAPTHPTRQRLNSSARACARAEDVIGGRVASVGSFAAGAGASEAMPAPLCKRYFLAPNHLRGNLVRGFAS